MLKLGLPVASTVIGTLAISKHPVPIAITLRSSPRS